MKMELLPKRWDKAAVRIVIVVLFFWAAAAGWAVGNLLYWAFDSEKGDG